MTIKDLPAINASLNAVSTIFISAGWFWIRRNVWQRHVPCMIVALVASSAFLVGYIVYHLHAGERSSGYSGLIAWIYFPILITHILLAFVTLPLVIVTLVPVFQRRWEDRKSTRLNSSHSQISYAVFCLKKKKNNYIDILDREKRQCNWLLSRCCSFRSYFIRPSAWPLSPRSTVICYRPHIHSV